MKTHEAREQNTLCPTPSQSCFRLRQIRNLLNYAKASGSVYNGQNYPAGYQTVDVLGLSVEGQRNPKDRIESIPIDFADKTVLDIGCNQGGMLFAISDTIRRGVGIDFDAHLINAANKISAVTGKHNLEFYVFNLDNENLDLIRNFIPEEKVDVAFLLSVCMWIKNWREVFRFVSCISDVLIFESNGSPEQQIEQLFHLKPSYPSIDIIRELSTDERTENNRADRRLYICKR